MKENIVKSIVFCCYGFLLTFFFISCGQVEEIEKLSKQNDSVPFGQTGSFSNNTTFRDSETHYQYEKKSLAPAEILWVKINEDTQYYQNFDDTDSIANLVYEKAAFYKLNEKITFTGIDSTKKAIRYRMSLPNQAVLDNDSKISSVYIDESDIFTVVPPSFEIPKNIFVNSMVDQASRFMSRLISDEGKKTAHEIDNKTGLCKKFSGMYRINDKADFNTKNFFTGINDTLCDTLDSWYFGKGSRDTWKHFYERKKLTNQLYNDLSYLVGSTKIFGSITFYYPSFSYITSNQLGLNIAIDSSEDIRTNDSVTHTMMWNAANTMLADLAKKMTSFAYESNTSFVDLQTAAAPSAEPTVPTPEPTPAPAKKEYSTHAISWSYGTEGCPETIFFDEKYFSQEWVDLVHDTEVDCLSSDPSLKNCQNIKYRYDNLIVDGVKIYENKTADALQEETVVIFTQAILALMNMLDDALDHGCNIVATMNGSGPATTSFDPNQWQGNEPVPFVYRVEELFQPDVNKRNNLFGHRISQVLSAIPLTESMAVHFLKNGAQVIVNKNKNSSATGYMQIVHEWCYYSGKYFSQPTWEVATQYDWVASSYRYGWNDYEVIPQASCVKRGDVFGDLQTYKNDNHLYHHPYMNLLGGFAINMRTYQQKRIYGDKAIQAGYAQYSGLSAYGYGVKKGVYKPVPALECGLHDVTVEQIFRKIDMPSYGGEYYDICREKLYSNVQ